MGTIVRRRRRCGMKSTLEVQQQRQQLPRLSNVLEALWL
jgi:hypothetical protein